MGVAEGGCLCKSIRYRVMGTPLAQSLCHCRSRRLAAGEFPPTREIWLDDRLFWEPLNDGLQHFRRSTSEGSGNDA